MGVIMPCCLCCIFKDTHSCQREIEVSVGILGLNAKFRICFVVQPGDLRINGGSCHVRLAFMDAHFAPCLSQLALIMWPGVQGRGCRWVDLPFR